MNNNWDEALTMYLTTPKWYKLLEDWNVCETKWCSADVLGTQSSPFFILHESTFSKILVIVDFAASKQLSSNRTPFPSHANVVQRKWHYWYLKYITRRCPIFNVNYINALIIIMGFILAIYTFTALVPPHTNSECPEQVTLHVSSSNSFRTYSMELSGWFLEQMHSLPLNNPGCQWYWK